MALVDYSSDSSDDDDDGVGVGPNTADNAKGHDAYASPRHTRESRDDRGKRKQGEAVNPSAKKPRLAAAGAGASSDASDAASASSSLPPLPAAFHDLYASTVRTSTRDDPSLHQGRSRQNPHVVGNWPSHLYAEWHPAAPTQAALAALLAALQERVTAAILPRTGGDERAPPIAISSFLTSDLGAPQPLHISLSRPLALATSDKDGFLERVRAAVAGSGVAPFALRCLGVEWHRTSESGRSFLVLRVQSESDAASPPTASPKNNPNPELTTLLRRCNGVARHFSQPELYQWAGGGGSEEVQSDHGAEEEKSAAAALGRAFHVSIAWTFAPPTAELEQLTAAVFEELQQSAAIQPLVIRVDGIKAKIGNVVTYVPLFERGAGGWHGAGGGSSNRPARSLLGL